MDIKQLDIPLTNQATRTTNYLSDTFKEMGIQANKEGKFFWYYRCVDTQDIDEVPNFSTLFPDIDLASFDGFDSIESAIQNFFAWFMSDLDIDLEVDK